MSRSIHKTIKQIAKENTKSDLNDPSNPDLVEYSKKIEYKKQEMQKRKSKNLIEDTEQ